MNMKVWTVIWVLMGAVMIAAIEVCGAGRMR